MLRVALALMLLLAACDGPKPPKTSPAAEHLARAEAAMEACKQCRLEPDELLAARRP